MSDELAAAAATDQPVDLTTESATEGAEDQSTDKVEGDPSQEKPAERTFTQSELDEIVSKRVAKEHRKLERRIEAQQAQQTQTVAAPEKPRLADYATEDDFFEAVGSWQQKQAEQQTTQRAQHQKQATFAAKTADLMADLDDHEGFDAAKFARDVHVTPHMAEVIVESDSPVKLALHLYENPAEASRIAALTPARQAIELASIAVKLDSSPKVKTPSKAPAPISPVSTKGGASTTDIYDSKLQGDAEAWIKVRNAQLASKR